MHRVKLESEMLPRFSLEKREAGGRGGGLAACGQAQTLSLRFSQSHLQNDWLNRTGVTQAASAAQMLIGKGLSHETWMSSSYRRPFD